MYHQDFPCLNTNNTMKYTHISMTGNLTVDYDTRNCLKRGELVVAGLHNKSAGCRYAVSNNEIELQNMLNSPNLKDVTLVTSLKLYKKERVSGVSNSSFLWTNTKAFKVSVFLS